MEHRLVVLSHVELRRVDCMLPYKSRAKDAAPRIGLVLLRGLRWGWRGSPELSCCLSAEISPMASSSHQLFSYFLGGDRREQKIMFLSCIVMVHIILFSKSVAHLPLENWWRYWCLTNWVLLKCKSLGLFSEVGGALELATDGEDFIVHIFFIINKGNDNRISFRWYCKLCGNQQFGFPHLTELEREGYLSGTDKSINAVANTSRADFMTLFGIDVYGKKVGEFGGLFFVWSVFSVFFNGCLLSLPVFWCFLIDQHKLFLSWLCTVHCKTKLLSWFMASRLC